jgi:hypothetical protein
MRFIKSIWKDIKRGENIELYVLLSAAIVALFLHFLDVEVQEYFRPLGLAAVAVFAIALLGIRHRLESQALPAVKVFKHWGAPEVKKLLSRTRKSLTVVDSWICEALDITRCLKDADRATSGNIEANFYLLDPDEPHGAQRVAAMKIPQKISDDEARHIFRTEHMATIQMLRDGLKEVNNVKGHIYTYPTMPSLRLYAVDDTEFLFCSFPLGKSTSSAACFYLSARSSDDASLLAIEEIRHQLKILQSLRTEIKERG